MTSHVDGTALAPSRFSTRMVAVAVAAAIAVSLAVASMALYEGGAGAKLSLSLAFGAVFGFVLQRSRFCFFCMFRDWQDRGDGRGLLGLVVALATGVLGYTLVFGAWLPDAFAGRLPPDAFIGPVSWVLVLAGLVFGAGMAISGSCVSAHLYRLGEGSPTAPFALVGTAVGIALGLWTWTPLYVATVSVAPVIWLPGLLGYTGAMVLALAMLALVAVGLRRSPQRTPAAPPQGPWTAVFLTRWPAWVGGLVIGALGTIAFLRVGPLGVTAEIGARSRQVATATGVLPSSIPGLDTLRGCVVAAQDALLSPNGAFVLALIASAFAAALVSGEFRPAWPNRGQVLRGLGGGVLLGWGAMVGLGCTVGTLLSGIMAGALSGWVFGAAVFAGIALTRMLGRRWWAAAVI